MVKIVVTDDQGRYVMPDLPKANYTVWVRGYGLVDSAKVTTVPGKIVNLTAVPAPNEAAAAEYYPPVYWLSMAKIPDSSEFPGTGNDRNGINPNIKSQAQFLSTFKTDGCFHCHGIGTKATRTLSPALGEFKTSQDAWLRRIQSGQASKDMVETIERFGTFRGAQMLADWTDRVAKGELPATKPQRPQGLERNLVITEWEWSGPKTYLHDEVATDKRNPTINAYGSLYGATENSTDFVPVFDPVKSLATTVKLPVRDPKTPSAINSVMMAPSPYWGEEKLWNAQTIPHSLMLDEKARVWFAARIRPAANPDACKAGSDHPSAKAFPINASNRHIVMLDPESKKFTTVSTCFPTHHVQFGFDPDRTLWTSSGGVGAAVLGWVNTKMLEETGDELKSQGWTPFILDTNGNGKRDEGYVEPNQPVDPAKDKRIRVGFYSIAPNPEGWLGLGHGDRISRLGGAGQSRRESVRNRAGGNLRGAGAGLLAARRRHRQPGRDVVRALERTSRVLRSQQVQGPAQRPERDRQALPRGLDALSAARTPARQRHRERQRRNALLRLGRPARHARPRQGRARCHRQSELRR